MTKLLTGAVLSAFLAYGAFEAYPLIAGPALTIEKPLNGARVEGGVVTVAGRARRVVALTLDGAPLLPDEAGRFNEELAFPTGGSILTFVATDRFGRSITKTRTLYAP